MTIGNGVVFYLSAMVKSSVSLLEARMGFASSVGQQFGPPPLMINVYKLSQRAFKLCLAVSRNISYFDD